MYAILRLVDDAAQLAQQFRTHLELLPFFEYFLADLWHSHSNIDWVLLIGSNLTVKNQSFKVVITVTISMTMVT
jgi:hypothetical protein